MLSNTGRIGPALRAALMRDVESHRKKRGEFEARMNGVSDGWVY